MSTTTTTTETPAPKASKGKGKGKAKNATSTATEQPAAAQETTTVAVADAPAAAPPETPTAVPDAPAVPAKPKVPGVAPTAKTRAYHAGLVIKKYGHAAGVTTEMVAEVDAAYGKPNPTESEICLRNAWHCIRAWTE